MARRRLGEAIDGLPRAERDELLGTIALTWAVCAIGGLLIGGR